MIYDIILSSLLAIDLLDTFGDFIQLGVAAVGFWLLYPVIAGILNGWKVPQVVGIIGVASIMWSTVYDYDLIVGYLIGSVAGVFGARKNYNMYKDKGDEERANLHAGILLTSLLVGLIMLIKIFAYML